MKVSLTCAVLLFLGMLAVPAASQESDLTPSPSPEEPVTQTPVNTPDTAGTPGTPPIDPTSTIGTPPSTATGEGLDTPPVTSTFSVPLLEIQGVASFQNRTGEIIIEVNIRDAESNLLGTALTDADGDYTLSVPVMDLYWLDADAPLHRPSRIQVVPGSDVPPIILSGGDLNDDGCVGPSDLEALIEDTDLKEVSQSDITGDGVTDGSDLAILAANYEIDCEAPVELEATVTPTPTETATPEVIELSPTPAPSEESPLIVTLPFYDSFSSDQGWLSNGAWQFDTQTAHSESGWFASSTARGQNSTLEYAGSFDFGGLEPLALTFWQRGALADVDVVAVELSVDSGISWMPIDQQAGLRTDWVLHTIDLEPYRDQVVKLRLRIDTTAELAPETGTLGYWLDDLAIVQPQPLYTPTASATPEGTVTSTVTWAPTEDGLTITPETTPTETGTATSTPLPLTLPFYDALDSEGGWSIQGAWRIDSENAHQGASWFVDTSSRGQSNTLTYQQPIYLDSVFNPVLSFWQKASLPPDDGVALDLSLDAGLSWITILQQNGLTTEWTQYEADLSLYRGQTIWLRFRIDTASQLPEGVNSLGCWWDELGIYEIQPVLTPSLLPSTTPTPTAVASDLPQVTPTPSALPTDSPTPTATLSPTVTAAPSPSLTPTLSPVAEEPTFTPTDVVTEDSVTPESS